jgi:hypothetical protein
VAGDGDGVGGVGASLDLGVLATFVGTRNLVSVDVAPKRCIDILGEVVGHCVGLGVGG